MLNKILRTWYYLILITTHRIWIKYVWKVIFFFYCLKFRLRSRYQKHSDRLALRNLVIICLHSSLRIFLSFLQHILSIQTKIIMICHSWIKLLFKLIFFIRALRITLLLSLNQNCLACHALRLCWNLMFLNFNCFILFRFYQRKLLI